MPDQDIPSCVTCGKRGHTAADHVVDEDRFSKQIQETITIRDTEMALLSRTRDSVTGDVHVQTARHGPDGTVILENFVCGVYDSGWLPRARMTLTPSALRILASF